ncbi:hypothetical protein ACFVP3_30620 [Streptomyces sp. NPDC057806]|uniref:hypothetical protein n=1 Tax=Streptomyces sp. NPDC057806 TaxID=3346255 RepID=UPI0036BC2A3D
MTPHTPVAIVSRIRAHRPVAVKGLAQIHSRDIDTTPALLSRLPALLELQATVLDGLGRQEDAESLRDQLRVS